TREIYRHRGGGEGTRKGNGRGFRGRVCPGVEQTGARIQGSESLLNAWTDEQLANWRGQMTLEERSSLKSESVKGATPQNLLENQTAKNLAIQHLFERASVARELHAAAMLLRWGIGRVSVGEARVFARTDERFVRRRGD